MSQAVYFWLIDDKQIIFFDVSIQFYHDFLFSLLFERQLPVESTLYLFWNRHVDQWRSGILVKF